jgi:hypothetical protein
MVVWEAFIEKMTFLQRLCRSGLAEWPVVECLSSKCEALSSIPVLQKNKITYFEGVGLVDT